MILGMYLVGIQRHRNYPKFVVCTQVVLVTVIAGSFPACFLGCYSPTERWVDPWDLRCGGRNSDGTTCQVSSRSPVYILFPAIFGLLSRLLLRLSVHGLHVLG